MVTGSLARRYAKALLAIGVEQQSFDAIGRELDRTADTFRASPELRTTLTNPVFPIRKRRMVLEAMARRLALSHTVRNFVMLLLEKGRMGALPDIARVHRTLIDEHAGRIRASVTSARPIDAALEERLRTMLEKRSGKTVIMETHEDPALLGGVIAQLGDLVFDGSVRTQLASMKEELLTD